jgi:hypothetical protein
MGVTVRQNIKGGDLNDTQNERVTCRDRRVLHPLPYAIGLPPSSIKKYGAPSQLTYQIVFFIKGHRLPFP